MSSMRIPQRSQRSFHDVDDAEAFDEVKQINLLRNQNKSIVHEASLEVKMFRDLRKKIDPEELKQQNISPSDVQKYSNFKRTTKMEYEEMETCNYHNTICLTHTQLCHERCRLPFTSAIGADVFKGCACMNGSARCHQCGCDHTSHYHDNKKPIKKLKTVEEILNEAKSCDDGSTSSNGINADIAALERAIDVKEATKQSYYEASQ